MPYISIKRVLILGLLVSLIGTTQALALNIHTVSLSAGTVGLYEPLFVYFGLSESYDNPFDPGLIDVTLEFTGPSGTVRTIPAFFTNSGPGWEARIAPLELGQHQATIVAQDLGENLATAPFSFNAVVSNNPGFIRIDDRDGRYMRFDDGSPYFPVGHNTCWGGSNPIHAEWQYNMGQAGENWTRYWMVPYVGQGIEWGSSVATDTRGLGTYSMPQCEMFDDMLSNARTNDLYVQMCLDSFNGWNTAVYANWAENAYNVVNGGMLGTPMDYFTHPSAQQFAKQRLRYIIARWGYSTNVICWEFWNEVDIAGAGQSQTFWNNVPEVVEWHRIMGDYVRSIDPFEHLRTTSFANDGSARTYDPFWELDQMDIVQIHDYHTSLPQAHILKVQDAQRYGKPIIVGEGNYSGVPSGFAGMIETDVFGAASVAPAINLTDKGGVIPNYSDPDGQTLHDMIWGVAVTQSGAMSWWWDGWIHPYDLYHVFTPLVAYVENEDFAIHGLTNADVTRFNATSDLLVCGAAGQTGAYLWLRDRTGPISNLQIRINSLIPAKYSVEFWDTYQSGMISEQVETTTTQGLMIDIPTFMRDVAIKVIVREPILAVEPAQIVTTTPFLTRPAIQEITISNLGLDLLTYTASANVPWLKVSPKTGAIIDETDTIFVIYNTDAFGNGTYEAEITIVSPESANSPIVIPLTLIVEPHPADLDRDDDVDQSDFGLLQTCLTPAGFPLPEAYCSQADLDGDYNVDNDDTTVIRGCMTGPQVVADMDCLMP